MTVQEKNLLAAEFRDRMTQFNHELDVWHLSHTQSAREEQVMSGVPRPERGETQCFVGALRLHPSRNRGYNIGVSGERQVMSVLLE